MGRELACKLESKITGRFAKSFVNLAGPDLSLRSLSFSCFSATFTWRAVFVFIRSLAVHTRDECRATRYNPLYSRLVDLPRVSFDLLLTHLRGLPVIPLRAPPPPLFLIAPTRGSVKTR